MADQLQVWTDDTEDWPKAASWDFFYPDTDRPVDDLEDAAAIAGRDVDDFARDLVRLPFGKAAPQHVIDQALARLG